MFTIKVTGCHDGVNSCQIYCLYRFVYILVVENEWHGAFRLIMVTCTSSYFWAVEVCRGSLLNSFFVELLNDVFTVEPVKCQWWSHWLSIQFADLR